MISKNIFEILLLFFFISLSAQKITIPQKDSFIPINSNDFLLMELKEGQRELYYTFDNEFADSDIVVNLKAAKQYTTRLYFYESYENIKVNSQDEFEGFIEELDLSEKFIYIKGSKKQTYYIVIKDLGNYSAKDYFSIYNEQSTIELKPEEPFTINLFLSHNLYTFSFKGEKDEVISLDKNINIKDFSETIVIYLNDEIIYKGIRNQGLIKLNEEKTDEGIYKVLISSTNEELYTCIKSSIVLYKEKNEVLELKPENQVEVFYLSSKTFSFYVDLNDYELNEENVITFKFSHYAVKNKLIEYCYAKNMNFKEFDNNKFISNMPAHEEESEADFSRLNSFDNVYHLYFSKTQKDEEDKNSYLLVHCSMKIDDELYIDPEKINVYLSPKVINIDFSEQKYLKNKENIRVNEKVNINDFTPQIYKINIPKNENVNHKISYVFYTDSQIQTVFEKTMKGVDHSNEELRQIFAVTDDCQENKILYIKIFGAKQEVDFKVESTTGDIYYSHGSERPTKVLSQQHLNCGNSFYYIGSYSGLAVEKDFYLEEIYGKYNIYYRNSISKNDDSILTNGNSKYLVKGKTGKLNSDFDIIELKCEYPGYFNFHLLKTSFTRTLTMYQRQIGLFSKGDFYIYPSINEDQTKINLEISTLLGKEVKINEYNDSNTEYIINSNNKYFQMKYKRDKVPNYIKMSVSEDNTLLSVKLTDDKLYKVVETNNSKINEERILFKLPNAQNYKNINITLKRVYHDYTYTIFRGDESYATDPIISGYDTRSLGEATNLNLVLSNPNIKTNSMTPDKEDSQFYIMFYIYDPEGIQKDINVEFSPVEQYKQIPNSVSQILAVEGEKYSLDIDKTISKVSVIYQSCGNSLKEVNIYSYDDILNSFERKNTYNLGVFNNYLIPNQLGPIFEKEEGNQYNGAVVGISLNEISQNDINNYNNYNYTVRQNGKVLKWASFKSAKEYVVYVFNKKNEDLKYIRNPCYLDFIHKNNLIQKDENDTTYIGIYTTTSNNYELKENGTFIATVMANLEGKIPMKYIYNSFNYDSNAEPYDEDDDDDNNNTLLIVLLVLVPIIIILIVVLIIILIRRNKQKEITDLPEDREKLIRDTTNSSNISQSRDN